MENNSSKNNQNQESNEFTSNSATNCTNQNNEQPKKKSILESANGLMNSLYSSTKDYVNTVNNKVNESGITEKIVNETIQFSDKVYNNGEKFAKEGYEYGKEGYEYSKKEIEKLTSQKEKKDE